MTQIHVIVIICSIAIFMFGLIAAPSTIYAQNTTITPSNATTAESHTTNTTGTPFNTTASSSSSSSSSCLAKDTTIIVDVYSGMTRTMHFKANETSNTLQGISVVLKC